MQSRRCVPAELGSAFSTWLRVGYRCRRAVSDADVCPSCGQVHMGIVSRSAIIHDVRATHPLMIGMLTTGNSLTVVTAEVCAVVQFYTVDG